MENEVIPELHLTRWLRCLLSREFNIENCLIVWDFIFAGAFGDVQDKMQNLDFLCTAMIMSKRVDLMESDFSMCLGILMSFKEPENIVNDILSKA